MERTPSVLLLADHAIAAREARASLGARTTVTRTTLARHDGELAADVVVLEQTLAAPPTSAGLLDLAVRSAGAPILSVVAAGAGRYRWLRVRSAGTLFRIEASGTGTLEDAVTEATRYVPPA